MAAPKGPQPLKFPGKNEYLSVLGDRPLVAETPEHLLNDDTTPLDKFYIRNNGQMPEQTADAAGWKITIEGEVDNKLEITLGELKSKFTPVTRRMVLECGGNGRSFFTPQARGNQWTNGGVGCAEWTGVRLADVLKAAGVKSSAVFTGHYGTDPHLSGEPNRIALSRGVPIKKAMDENNLIAWGMNGQGSAARAWSSGAARDRRLAGLGFGEVVQSRVGARQAARRPRHGRHVLSRPGEADRAGLQRRRKDVP